MSKDNTNKKRGFGIHFLFSTLNRFITLVRETFKTHITGMNLQSDSFSVVDKYVGIFRSPFCPSHGNFTPRLSIYLEKYKGNNKMIRYMFMQGSIPVIILAIASIGIGITLNVISGMEWKYTAYLIGISTIIYSFFINSFCTVLLNVNERYAGSSSAVIFGNIFSMASVGIPYIIKSIFDVEITGITLLASLILMNVTYSFIQSAYILFMSKDLLTVARTDTYEISSEDIRETRNMQKDVFKTFIYQSPKHIADAAIRKFITQVKTSIVSMVDLSHKYSQTITLCVTQPLHHMSYKILNQFKNEKEFKENAGDLFLMLHLFIIPFVLLISNNNIPYALFSTLFSGIIPKNSDIYEFIKIFQVVFYSTYLSSLNRLLKNIISLSTQSKTLAISSISGAVIPGSIVVMHIVATKHNIQTTYMNTEVLGNMLKYCLSIGDVIEFIYLMINTLKNKLIKFSYNQLIILLTSITSCGITLFTDMSIVSTLLIASIYLGGAIYNCTKYLNKR